MVKKSNKKARFFYLHSECNIGKICALDALHAEYVSYVRICVQCLLDQRKLTLPKKAMQAFFPPADILTSQIEKNARHHAIQIVSSWASSKYTLVLKSHIKQAYKNREIHDDLRKQLYVIGKRLISSPWEFVTQEAIDLYWSWLTDEELVGKFPSVSDRIPMRMSQDTCELENPQEAYYADLWIKISTLVAYKTIWLPLVGNLYIRKASSVSKGIHARKDRRGRWRFEAIDLKEWEIPKVTEEDPRIGIDVGLNVIAATSEGHTFGSDLKPKFDKLYGKVKQVRANRQRQGFKENSPRLDRLEARLSGMTKSFMGKVSNQLIRIYPKATFVIEDLNLRGCRGSKRFCYRALAHSLECKAPIEKVNPAYSSQTCPSCGHVSRLNRRGIDFVCRICGRCSHADVVGGINLLGRSEVKQVDSEDLRITLEDHPSEVREVLARLYWKRRNPSRDCPQDFIDALVPSSQKLTTKVFLKKKVGIASNQVVT